MSRFYNRPQKIFLNERVQLGAMAALYIGGKTHGTLDGLDVIDKCLDFAWAYEFELVKQDDEWLINTEKAREDAYEFASYVVDEYDEAFSE